MLEVHHCDGLDDGTRKYVAYLMNRDVGSKQARPLHHFQRGEGRVHRARPAGVGDDGHVRPPLARDGPEVELQRWLRQNVRKEAKRECGAAEPEMRD